jgi:hypothetical protein
MRLTLILALGACAMLGTCASLVIAVMLCVTVFSAVTTCSSLSDCAEATLASALFLGALASAVAFIVLTLRTLSRLSPETSR